MRKSQNHYFGLPGPDLEHILALAAADLAALRGKNIFITGGTGFFGKWILGGLLCANDELDLGMNLTVLSRHPSAFLQKHPGLAEISSLKFIQGNIADFSPPDVSLDFILHGATDTIALSSEDEERVRSQTILWGTRHMVKLFHDSGARRLLNISSGAVYGAAAGQVAGATEDEATLTKGTPLSAYGQAKLQAERRCEGSGIDYVTARAFAFLGPHLPLDAHFAAGNFLRDALRGGSIEVRGDGTAVRSYLHPADLVVWLLRLLLRGQRARAYNVGSDEAVTTAQLARLIANSVSPKAEVIIQAVQPQGPQNIYLPNITRAREELQLEVTIDLKKSVAQTLKFYE